ncbi:MAG: TolC family protein [Sumerlaeia bacterium]
MSQAAPVAPASVDTEVDDPILPESEPAKLPRVPNPERLFDDGTLEGLEGPARFISVQEILLMTLEQNLDIRVEEESRDAQAGAAFSEQGIYDPTVTARSTRSRTDEQTRNLGAAGGAGAGTFDFNSSSIYQDDTVTELILGQRTPLGTRVEIFARDHRQDIMDGRADTTLSPSYRQEAGLRVTQPLLKNFGPLVNNAPIRIANRRLDQSNWSFRGEVQERLSDVMQSYYELIFAYLDLEVQKTALESARELERNNRARVEVGTEPRLSLYQAEAQVAEREAQVIRAEAEILRAQDQLRRLTNWDAESSIRTWDGPLVPTDRLFYNKDLQLQEPRLIDVAFTARPDMQIARLETEIAEIDRDVAKRQRLPELNAFGEYSYSGVGATRWGGANEELDGRDYANYSFGAEFIYPLFNRQARGRFQQTEALLRRAELSQEQLEVLITAEVRQAVRIVRTALARIQSNQRQVIADRERVRSQRLRLQEGEGTQFELLEAEDDLASSRAALARALVDYQQGVVEVARSTGTLLSQLNIAVDDQEEPQWYELNYSPEQGPAVRPGEGGLQPEIRPSAIFSN